MAGDPYLAREEDEDEQHMGLSFGASAPRCAAHHLTVSLRQNIQQKSHFVHRTGPHSMGVYSMMHHILHLLS